MIKTLILLRHGQYIGGDKERLTALGRRQARLAGRRLQDFKIDSVVVSTMPRAQETARIALKNLKQGFESFESTDLLRECIPGFPEKLRIEKKLKKSVLNKQKKVLDEGYKKYFTFSKTETTQLIVCHGNVMRYLVCKALGIPTLKWVRLDIKQCGLTIITLNSKTKEISLIAHNDVGHIPVQYQTFI